MWRTTSWAVGLVSLGIVGVAEDRVAPPGVVPPVRRPPIVRPPIVKPLPPVRAPEWTVTVREKSRFDEKQWGEASEPTSDRGLRITLQPERKSFAGNGPLAFRVELTNTTDGPLVLANGSKLGDSPRLVLANQKTAAQWSLSAKSDDSKPLTIPAGESVQRTLVVSAEQVFVPLPQPIPRPIPFRIQPAKGDELQAKKKVQPAGAQPIIRPAGPIVAQWATVPVGQGTVRVRLLLEFEKSDAKNTWSGKLASKPVECTIGGPEAPPVIGVPTTREQAIQKAMPAAEAALSANDRPVPGIRPGHVGEWLVDPEKTAEVKETDNGWRVSWTHTPKGKGFGYNVSVDVNRGGGTVVREVFTSYSPR